MKTLTVPADTRELDRVTTFVDGILEEADCPMEIQFRVELAVEELFVNIASYAYGGSGGTVELKAQILPAPQRLELSFRDSGAPFDPLAKPDADTSPEATLNREGGLGILLVKKTMDEVRYTREKNQNLLTVVKNLRR